MRGLPRRTWSSGMDRPRMTQTGHQQQETLTPRFRKTVGTIQINITNIDPATGKITTEEEGPSDYNYKGSVVTINEALKGNASQTQEVLKHETGHVHNDRTNADKSVADTRHTKATNGRTPHDQRPEEKEANKFKDKVTKEQKEYKKQQEQQKKEKNKNED